MLKPASRREPGRRSPLPGYLVSWAMVLPAMATAPKRFTEACTKILAKQNTAP